MQLTIEEEITQLFAEHTYWTRKEVKARLPHLSEGSLSGTLSKLFEKGHVEHPGRGLYKRGTAPQPVPLSTNKPRIWAKRERPMRDSHRIQYRTPEPRNYNLPMTELEAEVLELVKAGYTTLAQLKALLRDDYKPASIATAAHHLKKKQKLVTAGWGVYALAS